MAPLKRIPLPLRRFLKSFAAAAVFTTGLFACAGSHDSAPSQYYASWTGSVSNATESRTDIPGVPQAFNNQTVRHVVRLSLSGDSIKVKITNLFGKTPITFSGVRVAKSTGDSTIDVTTDRVVTFGGQASVTVPAGVELLSDAVALPVAAQSNVAVSMYFATPTTVSSVHALGRQIAYIGAGNQLSTASIPVGTSDQRQSYFGLTAVEAASTEKTKVVVTFGDSITDGYNSTVGAAKRYPNQLDDRLKAAGMARVGVANEGISGNRWLNDVSGPKANGRFERDVLNVAGVTHTIILLGINDIGFSEFLPAKEVSVEKITASLSSAVTKAKAKGIEVFLGTLTPFKGAVYFSAAGEAKRQAVNAFIRNNKEVDGVIDFDRTLQNPADPTTMNPAYDSGDHLHPNDVGYGAMAAAIDLAKLQ
jgi:lysophospholipase L1-like esterase